MAKKPDWINEQEASEMMGLKPRTLRVYTMNAKRKKFEIKTSKVSKTKIYYDKTDILYYINNLITA